MAKRVSAETPQSGAPRAGLNGIGPVSAPKTLATNLVVHGICLFSSSVSPLYLCASCKGALSWNVVRGMASWDWFTPWMMDGFLANYRLHGLKVSLGILGLPPRWRLPAFAKV